jgi:tungstate transport system substrate-binding protein
MSLSRSATFQQGACLRSLPGRIAARLRRPAQEKFIVMASTTSTEQSGLFAHLLPAFKQATGIDVRVVALGTGQALDAARRGDADVVFVHDQAAEEKFVAEGFGLQRQPVMYNDFVIIGPKSDPAGLRGSDVAAAMKKLVATANVSFVSRGDRSGTHCRRAALLEGGRRGRGHRQGRPATRSAAAAWARR